MTPYMTRDDVRRAGAIAGQHLDSIGKGSAFDKITPDEWLTTCLIIVNEANKAAGDRIVAALTVPLGGEG
ncbi:hypothetical protein [Brevundimonas sp.]|uniref:hypothetical protein n=1 Tax=Brevundimonas sp. TaxID=1871086 RepID=UPI0025B94632|nr:hypothetical protein [Brevundimonas sp.]